MSGEVRQLSLFKSRRQRGVVPPSPKEFAVHCALADTIRKSINRGWEWTHIGHGELRSPGAAARLKRMGLRPGFPDFIFVGPRHSVVWLELKREGGRLSEDQARIAKHLIASGFPYLCTDSLKDAVATLCDLGVLRKMEIW